MPWHGKAVDKLKPKSVRKDAQLKLPRSQRLSETRVSHRGKRLVACCRMKRQKARIWPLLRLCIRITEVPRKGRNDSTKRGHGRKRCTRRAATPGIGTRGLIDHVTKVTNRKFMDIKAVHDEARTRALTEAKEAAREDVKAARLYGAAAERFFRSRMDYHFEELGPN